VTEGPELANCTFTILDSTSAVLTAPAIVTLNDLDERRARKQGDEQSQLQTSEVLPNGEVELKFRAGAKSSSGNHRVADWSTGTSLSQSLRVSAFSISRSTINTNTSVDSLPFRLTLAAKQNYLKHRFTSDYYNLID
jgi:hypothetical protein